MLFLSFTTVFSKSQVLYCPVKFSSHLALCDAVGVFSLYIYIYIYSDFNLHLLYVTAFSSYSSLETVSCLSCQITVTFLPNLSDTGNTVAFSLTNLRSFSSPYLSFMV